MGTSSDHSGGNSNAWNRARNSGRNWASAGGGDGAGLVKLLADVAAALSGYEGRVAANASSPALARLGDLSQGPTRDVLAEVMRQRGKDLTDCTLQEVHEALVDYLAGEPEDRDADLTRFAADQTVTELLDQTDDIDNVVITDATAERLLSTFVCEWLTRLIVRELGTSIIEANPADSQHRVSEIQQYVSARLGAAMRGRAFSGVDWRSDTGRQTAFEILNGAREVFGADTNA